ncbi:hypothetical protein EMPS_10433 [Entomortierella parvispora]|uniref:RRM domain-containing protein n=1 Tax=Entomortierella parvispora TaxID=205924 RepID=A0A9P3HJV8_9FUNG|nr:hypothetical protein EMPS_10433 [Entomortierella parvispora]
MSLATLALTLAQTARVTVPRLTPGSSSSLFRFMSTQAESESLRQKNKNVVPNQTTTSSNYQGRKPKKVYVHNSNENSSQNHVNSNGNSFVKPQDNPNLYRLFFRSPDKLGSLEEAQVFISHIKSNYGPLTQYQFSRCPETKRYFGYGFLTFKNEESIDKALADGYIRVGRKDFELKRTGFIPIRRAVKHTNTGFNGFYDLEELRAKSAQAEQAANSGHSDEGRQGVEEEGTVSSEGAAFVSALSKGVSGISSEPTISGTNSTDQADSVSTRSSSESSSKPYFKPLQKKGHAQLWKTLPAEIERAEQDSRMSRTDDEKLD